MNTTTQEILLAHDESFWDERGVKVCQCGYEYTEGYGSIYMIRHVAEVLDKHVRIRETQAQVSVLSGVASAWEEIAPSGATHLYVLMLRETAKRIGADIVGS